MSWSITTRVSTSGHGSNTPMGRSTGRAGDIGHLDIITHGSWEMRPAGMQLQSGEASQDGAMCCGSMYGTS